MRTRPRTRETLRRTLAAAVVATAASAAALAAGCATYRNELARSQQAFDANQHERALGLLRDLEKDVPSLSFPEQAEYAYLRGMTDYRIGYRADARHWLAVARTYDERSPGVLPADWKARLGKALDEMNAVVYDQGLGALATDKKPGEDEAPAPAKAKQP
jgi:hypothetical protein